MPSESPADRSVAVVAISVVCPADTGSLSQIFGRENAPAPSWVNVDPQLQRLQLKHPFAARCALNGDRFDRASALLLQALGGLEGLTKQGRWGLAIGTSSGAMTEMCHAFESIQNGLAPEPSLLARATYERPFFDLQSHLEATGLRFARSVHCLSACAASTIAMGLGFEWIRQGHVDAAIVGGYDALSDFVAIGFESLGATTHSMPPRPLRADRTGLALGEGAALLVLMAAEKAQNPLAWVTGFGLTSDAIHLTAPDREGRAMARAIAGALSDTPPTSVDFISMHATGTSFNDAMEAKAIHAAIPNFEGLVHAAKATLGHTLGASGAIETALTIDAMRSKVLPATAGEGSIDPALSLRTLDVSRPGTIERALKLSAAFGGVNAAICLQASRPRSRELPPKMEVERFAAMATLEPMPLAELALATGISRDRLARMDVLCHYALTGLALVCKSIDRETLRGAAIVLSTHFSTLESNQRFFQSYAKKGASGRVFAYTTPNAVLGECSIAYGLTGPSIAVSGDHGKANEIARHSIENAHASIAIAMTADAPSDVAKTWAAACDLAPVWGVQVTLWRRQ